jgi:ferredoxin
MKNSFDTTTRLSCQITVKPEIEELVFHIEK